MEAIKTATTQTEGMLTRFRRQFIATNMVFAAIVLLVVLIVVAAIAYNQHREDVYEALQQRIELARTRSEILGIGQMRPGLYGSQEEAMFEKRRRDKDTLGAGTPYIEHEESHRESDTDQFVATSLYVLDEQGSLLAIYDEAFPLDDDVLDHALDHVMNDVDEAEKSGISIVHNMIRAYNLYYRVEPLGSNYLVACASGRYIDRNMYGLLIPLFFSELMALLAFLGLSHLLARWAVKPVEEAWDKQQQFIADASHELKTPLTVIRANDSILLSQPNATVESQSQWIESTETEAQLMQDLVDDLLYLAKADHDRTPIEMSTVNISDIVNSQLLQFESIAFEKGLTMTGEVTDNITLLGDGTRLSRLVGTLLDNACKYAEENSQVSVRLTTQGNTCRLVVHNTGNPIDSADLPHLFDRFYRSDKARTRQGGYGLGLSIAKSIAEDHGGSILVTSSAEEGTSFIVSLPIDK